MNKYVRKFFGVMFQSQQTQQVVRIQPQHLPTSPEEWRVYWQSQGQPWRTEPEIDVELHNKQREVDRLYGKLAAASPLTDAELRHHLQDALFRLTAREGTMERETI